jgi:multidrug efflux pump subunit AcrA (membrane-fusion protein)
MIGTSSPFGNSAAISVAALWWVSLSLVFCCGRPAFAQPPAALVELDSVVEKKLAGSRNFTGTVVPPRTSVVGSAVDGRVDEAEFDEGDLVRMVKDEGATTQVGTPLVQLRTRTISLEIAAGTAELDLRRQEEEQLQRALPEEIAQAKATLLAMQAKMNYQRSRYERVRELTKTSAAASEEEQEEARSAWLAVQQEHLAASSKLQQLENTRTARLAQARARRQVAEEQVRRLKDILSKYTIRAPFDGFVIKKHTEVGAWLSKGDPVAEIIELDPVEVAVFVPEHYIARVKTGAPVSLSIDALPGQKFTGNVHRIAPQADLRSRSFAVKIRLENPEYVIKAGMLVAASIPVGSEQPVMMVPKDSLVLDRGRRTVVVARADPTSGQTVAHIVPVETGAADGSLIHVIGDLKPGEKVVVRGNERLRPGQPLRTAGPAGQPPPQ